MLFNNISNYKHIDKECLYVYLLAVAFTLLSLANGGGDTELGTQFALAEVGFLLYAVLRSIKKARL